MPKRRELVKKLRAAGFSPDGGTNHERFIHPDGRTVFVPRHSEISNIMAQIILKEAGLR